MITFLTLRMLFKITQHLLSHLRHISLLHLDQLPCTLDVMDTNKIRVHIIQLQPEFFIHPITHEIFVKIILHMQCYSRQTIMPILNILDICRHVIHYIQTIRFFFCRVSITQRNNHFFFLRIIFLVHIRTRYGKNG